MKERWGRYCEPSGGFVSEDDDSDVLDRRAISIAELQSDPDKTRLLLLLFPNRHKQELDEKLARALKSIKSSVPRAWVPLRRDVNRPHRPQGHFDRP